jgi:hypothetical protein
MTQTHEFNENLALGSDWDKSLKSMNEYAKKWADEEIDKIKYNVVKEIIQRETKND